MQEDPSVHQYTNPAGEQPAEPARPPRRGWRLLLVSLPYAACILCLIFGLVGMSTRVGPYGPRVPVTGPNAPALEPAAPDPAVDGTPSPEYGLEAELRLSLCRAAFQNFFMLEHLVHIQPGLIHSSEWRSDAQDAASTFRRDCALADGLPQAPAVYREVDRWMRLAAAEVVPAADSFSQALEADEAGSMFEATGHLENFYEYSNNAEAAMRVVRSRKEI